MADQKRPSVIQTEDQNLKITTDEPLDPLEAKNLQNIRQLLFKLETTALNVNRLDYYGFQSELFVMQLLSFSSDLIVVMFLIKTLFYKEFLSFSEV